MIDPTKGKPIAVHKHIHSCPASMSSNDASGYFMTYFKELDFPISIGKRIVSAKFPILNGETITGYKGDASFGIIYTESDKTFYEKGFAENKIFGADYHKTPEFAALVKSYSEKGWNFEIGYAEVEGYKEFDDRESARYYESKLLDGIVLHMPYDEYKGHPEYFQGGFSDAVFNSPEIKSYVGEGRSVHGWIGHSGGRKKWHDTLIEDGLRKYGIADEGMYAWISSSNGRHFADSLEGATDDEQRATIEESHYRRFNLSLIYNFPKHEGTWESTTQIERIMDEHGCLYRDRHDTTDCKIKLLAYLMMLDTYKQDFTAEQMEKALSVVSPEIRKTVNL